MTFDDRIGWMLLGMAVGFIAGYIVRALRELRDDVHDVKEELHEVDEIVKSKLNDSGFMDNKLIANIMMLVVLAIVVWAAVSSQLNSNRIARVSSCNEKFLTQTLSALNERTTYSQEQAQKNVELQKAQAEFFSFILERPPHPRAEREASAQEYLQALTEFVVVNAKSSQKVANNPFPTDRNLQDCLK